MNSRPNGGAGDRALPGIAVAFAVLHAALSMAVLAFGYPHEDAYILFKYSRNVANGFGVVFYPGGPHAEGATDFLWMMALAGLAKLHIEPALGAVALNAAGFGFAVHRALLLIGRGASRRITLLVGVFGSALMLLHAFSVAGAVGFSATLYAALSLELFRLTLDGRARAVPGLALLLGLIRPDGVVLGAGATIIALHHARTSGRAGELRQVLTRLAVCGLVGATYFVLRARYFGHVLPLPLLVKSHYEGWPPGLESTFDWTVSTLLPLVGVLGCLRLAFGPRARIDRAAYVASLPFLVHVLAFAPSVPSQNVANRFQSPAALVLYVLVLGVVARALVEAEANRVRPSFVTSVAAITVAFPLACYPHALVSMRALRDVWIADYVNPFSARVGQLSRERTARGLPPLRIASTEAGRLLYWTEGPVLDLVGLNSPETAKRPPTWEVLRRFDADVMMIHPAGTMFEDGIERGRKDDAFVVAPPIASYVFPWNAQFLSGNLAPYRELRADNVRVAPVATATFWDERAVDYEFYAARFEARFARLHLYAIKKNLPEKETLVRELALTHERSRQASHLSVPR